MVRRIPWLTGIIMGLMLAGALLPGNQPPEGAGPSREPFLCFGPAPAHAAGWAIWGQQPATPLAFGEMYGGVSALGLEFSAKLKALEGQRVVMTGFMAPPLKPTLSFFVLTQVPMAVCPFCSTDADWPSDIVVVKLAEAVTALPYDRPVKVTGTLELGSRFDSETGFVSLVRIQAETVETTD
jgi:hypothetical protein